MATQSGRSSRGAAPRVQIVYETEADGRRQRRELPFVLGVLGDLGGNGGDAVTKLRDRKFRAVDGSTFNNAMEAMRPQLKFRVDNTLRGDDSTLAINLAFRSLNDFGPEEVAMQVPPLRQLIEVRSELNDLLRQIHERRRAGE